MNDDIILARRRMLGWGAALASATLAPNAWAATPKVFLNYTQDDLDRNYDQAPWAPNHGKIIARNNQKVKLALSRLGDPSVHRYGPGKHETLDLHRARKPKAPIQIFIHGGAWRAGEARAQASVAPKYVMAGAHFIALDFSTVMEAGLDGMVDQVRRAIAWVYLNAESFDGDRDRIFISGHSSGGHLGGVMTITDWKALGLPADVIKGAVLTSGIYDLYPVRKSKRSSYVPFTDAIEEDFSTIRHLDKISCPMIIGYGEYDTDEFRRQSQEFAAALKKIGKLQKLVVVGGANHFEVPESFADPFGVVGYESLQQMGFDPFRQGDA